MSQMDIHNRDFDGVEFKIEQDGHLVWLRWPGQDDNILLGPVEMVAERFRNWLESMPQPQPEASGRE